MQEIYQKLEAIRKIATERGRFEQRYLNEKEVLITAARCLPVTTSLTLPEAIKHDLRIMTVCDAVASWCDVKDGLARQFPKEVLGIVETLLPTEK